MPELDLGQLPLVDTHEHLRPETERVQVAADPLTILFLHYSATDLQTAGLSRRDLAYVRDPAAPLLERWAAAEPFWQEARLTGYGRAIRTALQDLYEISDLRAETLEALAGRMRSAAVPGLYRRVFDRAGIRWALVQDIDPGPVPQPADPPDCIRTALQAGPLVWIRSKQEVEAVVEQLGLSPVHSLLLEFREGRFAIFHGGYPWTGEFAVLGKSFPNVWLDRSWLWIISAQAGCTLLHQLIESVPRNKVTAFGGDNLFVEGTYGHRRLMRQAVTRVMQEKVAAGWLNPAEAMDYARAILADNAQALYRGDSSKSIRDCEVAIE